MALRARQLRSLPGGGGGVLPHAVACGRPRRRRAPVLLRAARVSAETTLGRESRRRRAGGQIPDRDAGVLRSRLSSGVPPLVFRALPARRAPDSPASASFPEARASVGERREDIRGRVQAYCYANQE